MVLFKKHIPLFVLFLFCQNAIADATPFKRKLTINLDLKNPKKDTIQKVCILSSPDFKISDTICGYPGSTCMYIEDKTIYIIRSIPENFRLFFQIGNKKLISPILNETDTQSLIELQITDTEIIETTPFFRVPLKDYLLALLLTILIELLFAAAFFIKHKIKQINLFYVLLCSLISHPILWLICSYFIGWGINLLLAETAVIIFEATLLFYIIKTKLSFQKLLLLSFIINSASFIFGGILYLVLS